MIVPKTVRLSYRIWHRPPFWPGGGLGEVDGHRARSHFSGSPGETPLRNNKNGPMGIWNCRWRRRADQKQNCIGIRPGPGHAAILCRRTFCVGSM